MASFFFKPTLEIHFGNACCYARKDGGDTLSICWRQKVRESNPWITSEKWSRNVEQGFRSPTSISHETDCDIDSILHWVFKVQISILSIKHAYYNARNFVSFYSSDLRFNIKYFVTIISSYTTITITYNRFLQLPNFLSPYEFQFSELTESKAIK